MRIPLPINPLLDAGEQAEYIELPLKATEENEALLEARELALRFSLDLFCLVSMTIEQRFFEYNKAEFKFQEEF